MSNLNNVLPIDGQPERNEAWREQSVLLNHLKAAWDEAIRNRRQALLQMTTALNTYNAIDRALLKALTQYEEFCRTSGFRMAPQHEDLARRFYNEDGEFRSSADREEI